MNHNVAAIAEDDYMFWDLLFGEGRKKERERWRSLKSRLDDPGDTRPDEGARIFDDRRQPGMEINVSYATLEPG